jgi:hypothetical protein
LARWMPRLGDRTQNAFQDFLVLQPDFEPRRRLRVIMDRLQKIGKLVDERVLITDAVARRPPVVDVRVTPLVDLDAAEPGDVAGIVGVVVLQPVHVLQSRNRSSPSSR